MSLGVRGRTHDSAGAGPKLTGGECLIWIGKGLCTACVTSCCDLLFQALFKIVEQVSLGGKGSW
jgi:hypothetical protein